MEEKQIKTKNIIIAVCLVTIIILIFVLALFFLKSNIEKKNLEEQINKLETMVKEIDNSKNEEKNKISNTIEAEQADKKSDILNKILLTKEPINPDNIYGFACKTEIINEQYIDTLVAINKDDNSEIPIMNFSSGAYDYFNNKIYFYTGNYNKIPELKSGFYMISLDKYKNPMVQAVYLTDKEYAYLDELKYNDEKLYFTANGYIYYLDINNEKIKKIDSINNYLFDINNETDILYYTNENADFCEMNLLTGEINLIHENASIEYCAKDKLIYNYNGLYYEYNLNEKTHKKITESWGGTLGKFNIVRENKSYIYIATEPRQVIMQTDEGKKEVLVKETGYDALTILSNNKILLERNEAEDYGDDYKTYIYDILENKITETNTNYRYSFMKKAK